MPPRRGRRNPRRGLSDDPLVGELEEAFGAGIERAKGMAPEVRVRFFEDVLTRHPDIVSPRGGINLDRAREALMREFGVTSPARARPESRKVAPLPDPFVVSALRLGFLRGVRAQGFRVGPGFEFTRPGQTIPLTDARSKALLRLPTASIEAGGLQLTPSGTGRVVTERIAPPGRAVIPAADIEARLPQSQTFRLLTDIPLAATVGVGVGSLGLSIARDHNETQGGR